MSHKTTNKEDPGVIHEDVTVVMPHTIDGELNPARKNLSEMLSGSTNASSVNLKYILPKFLKVTNRGTAKPLDTLLKPVPSKYKVAVYFIEIMYRFQLLHPHHTGTLV